MAELHVRNLPDDLHAALRARARAEGRSMSSQSVVLLTQALRDAPGGSTERGQAVARLRRIQARSVLDKGLPPAQELVREDRDGRG